MNTSNYPNWSLYWLDGGTWRVVNYGRSSRYAFDSLESAKERVAKGKNSDDKFGMNRVFRTQQIVIVRYDGPYQTKIECIM